MKEMASVERLLSVNSLVLCLDYCRCSRDSDRQPCVINMVSFPLDFMLVVSFVRNPPTVRPDDAEVLPLCDAVKLFLRNVQRGENICACRHHVAMQPFGAPVTIHKYSMRTPLQLAA